MWSFDEGSQLHSFASSRVIRSNRDTYERPVDDPHDISGFQGSMGRNARVDALREELHAMVLQDATTFPPAPVPSDMVLPSSVDSSRTQPAPQAPPVADVAHVGGLHMEVLESWPHRRVASRSVSDGRRFGIYLPSATASENNLPLHRPGPFTLHGLQERAASFAPASSTATPEQPARCRPQSSPHRFDDATNEDPPPNYVAFDPYPFFDTEPKPRRQSTIQMIENVRKDGFKATTGKVGKSVVKHVEDVGKIAKDVPNAFKEAQVRLSSKRAKGKIRWLEKRNYLSGQERLLTQALVG